VQLSATRCTCRSRASSCRARTCRCCSRRSRSKDKSTRTSSASAIRKHLEDFDWSKGEAEFALAFGWRGAPSYERLSAFARALTLALERSIERAPAALPHPRRRRGADRRRILKEDWAIASEVLVLDGITLRDFDYVDLGRIRMPSYTVPVTIKSLVFSQDPRLPNNEP
jgi:ethanolamine utilization protein EutA